MYTHVHTRKHTHTHFSLSLVSHLVAHQYCTLRTWLLLLSAMAKREEQKGNGWHRHSKVSADRQPGEKIALVLFPKWLLQKIGGCYFSTFRECSTLASVWECEEEITVKGRHKDKERERDLKVEEDEGCEEKGKSGGRGRRRRVVFENLVVPPSDLFCCLFGADQPFYFFLGRK